MTTEYIEDKKMKKVHSLYYATEQGVKSGVFIKANASQLKKIIKKEIDYNDFCISLTKKQIMHNEKRADFEVFTIDLINESIITKDNIHLYYEFMSNAEKLKYLNIFDILYNDRFVSVYNCLNISPQQLRGNSCILENHISIFYTDFFGVKDTLKPIDEYIAEIKASEEYRAYTNKAV